MSTVDENVLIANGVVRSQASNELYCAICPTQLASKNWSAHIDDPNHIGALRQFNLVFVVNGDKINCKSCNMIFDWEALRNHAIWHRIIPWYVNDDRDKMFFENRMLHWENRYYCFLCDVIFADGSNACVHIGDEKHQNLISLEPPVNDSFKPVGSSYESLISEGFEPWGTTTVKCRICNYPNVILRNIEQHIDSFEHLDAKLILKEKLEKRGTSDAPKIDEKSTDGEIPAHQHRQGAVSRENYNGGKIPAHQYRQGAVSHENSNDGKIPAHQYRQGAVTRENSTDGKISAHQHHQRAVSCENSTTRYNQQVPRYRQDPKKFGHKNFQNSNKNLNDNANIPSRQNFPVQSRGRQGLYCTICENWVISETREEHVAGEKHLSILRSYGHEYISPIDNVKFNCCACSCVVPNLENVYRHIKGLKHRAIIEKQRKKSAPEPKENYVPPERPKESQNPTKSKTTSFKMNFPQPSQPVTRSSCAKTSPLDHLVKRNLRDFHCRLCDVLVYGPNANYHLTSDPEHREAVNIFQADFMIDGENVFRCQPCKSLIVGQDGLYDHMRTQSHQEARIRVPKSSFTSDVPTEISRQNLAHPKEASRINETLEQNGKSTNPSDEWIVKVNKTDYACKICHLLLFDHSTIGNHLDSPPHANSLALYIKTEPSEDEKFYCRPCRCTIPNFANVFQHSIGTRHKTSMHLPIKDYSNLRETHQDTENLSRAFIARMENDDFNCRICNVYLEDRSSLEEHTNGEYHAKTLIKYGCEKIFWVRGNSYKCEWCDCDIPSLDNIYVHLAGKRHPENLMMKRKTIPEYPGASIKEVMGKPLNPDKSEKTAAQSEIPRSQSLTRSSEPMILDCHENKTIPKYPGESIKEVTKVSPVIDNEPMGQPINPEKSEKMTAQSEISRSQSLTPSECHATTSKSAANNAKEFPSDGSARFRSTSNCEIRRTSVDPEGNVSTKHSTEGLSSDSNDGFVVFDDATENGSSKADDSQSLRRNEASSSRTMKFAENLSSSLSINQIGNTERKRRAPKTSSQKESTTKYDHDDDYIHDMRDKLRQIETGYKLCLVGDFNETYCLICRSEVVGTVHNYHEHLRSLQHCEFLDGMEKDHAAFEVVTEQHSELDLAFQYMLESFDAEDIIRCTICKVDIANDDRTLQDHINYGNHRLNVMGMRSKVKNVIDDVQSRIKCDWYNIFKYLCVPCNTTFESEIKFAKHLKSEGHSSFMKKSTNTDRTLIFDFCSPCALLWYGYRSSYIGHCDIPTHKWLIRDENYLSPQLPTSAKCLLAKPDDYIEDNLKYFDETLDKEQKYIIMLVQDLEKTVKINYPDAKAYPFGSRVAGLDSEDSNIHVFLDCGNMYDGNTSLEERMSYVKTKVSQCLIKETQTWDMEEVSEKNPSLIIKARHRETRLNCDIHFDNGLAFENTILIMSLNEAFPACRRMIIFLEQWLKFCNLSGNENITIDALCWFVIFYLQNKSILPSIARMIEMEGKSHLIAGWEVGVHRKFICNETESRDNMMELLVGFFTFYANFDYRRNVACPLMGEAVKKRLFTKPKELPKEMELYVNNMSNFDKSKSFGMDSPMCLQHPFDLTHNLTESMSKVSLSRFRTFCFKSLDVLDAPSNQ